MYEGSVAYRTVLLGTQRNGATLWASMPAIFITFSTRQCALQTTGMCRHDNLLLCSMKEYDCMNLKRGFTVKSC